MNGLLFLPAAVQLEAHEAVQNCHLLQLIFNLKHFAQGTDLVENI
jgi:hypothetical protein